MEQKEITPGVFIEQEQQGPETFLPNSSVQFSMLDASVPETIIDMTLDSITSYSPYVQFWSNQSATYNATCFFKTLSCNATIGATYTNNGATFTVKETVSGATTLMVSLGSGAPQSSGILTKVSGTGDSTIFFEDFKRPKFIITEVVGAGGGGGGAADNDGIQPGTAGTSSTVDGTLIACSGGAGGQSVYSGSGGAVSFNASLIQAIASVQGGRGHTGGWFSTGRYSTSIGHGASSPLGAGGAGGEPGGGGVVTGTSGFAATGYGAGGGGGNAVDNANTHFCGAGGSAGGYFKGVIRDPALSYAIVAGTRGIGGAAGPNGTAGNVGSHGAVIFIEHFD
jgi:hypothetical protein